MQGVFTSVRPVGGILGHLGAKHWAIRVGKYWYQVAGGADETKGDKGNYVKRSEHLGEDPYPSTLFYLGSTYTSDIEIQEMVREWMEGNPNYHLTKANCQDFVNYILQRLGKVPKRTQAGQLPTVVPEERSRLPQ